ncbi:MAG: phage protease [Gammaproteobacteria bacterium]|nr:phage protease [Gammaproteobacteria bacterium]MBU1978604.1 phage protease [Gammaproteobacteria bacterium]
MRLEAGNPSGAVRFLSGLHVNLEEGKNTSWVTLTRTGTFSDPRYGKFDITREMLLSMVRNFDARTYGQDIFADVSHRPDLGAAGTFLSLKIEGDRLRAQVEWTPYGIDAIKSKGYKYFSVEFHENWKDNEAGKQHGTVLLGAALTVRPVIKGLAPVTLSEAVGETPTYLHPELQSTLLEEISVMKEKMLKALRAKLEARKLAEVNINQILLAYAAALGEVTDEAKAEVLLAEFDVLGQQLFDAVGEKPATIQLSVAGTGVTAADVTRILAESQAKVADEARKLAEGRETNVKLLADTINAAAGLDDATKKALAAEVADLITPAMTADQVKRLAENQIKHGNEVVAARQLSNMGFQWPAGNVHISVDSSNNVKALQEQADKILGYTSMHPAQRFDRTAGQLQTVNKELAEKVLAQFDAANGPRLHAEHKLLAAGDSVVSDVAVPASFERTVIREALYNMVGLQFMDVGVEMFSTVHQIPYSYRDTTAAGRGNTRTFEGQPIKRAALKQTVESAYQTPQKIAFEVSDELGYLTSNGQLNWNAMMENARNAVRIIGEDTEQLVFDETLNASDQYATVAVVGEATGTGNAAKTIFPLGNFPVVRPKKVYDLQGTLVGSALYGITVTVAAAAKLEYDGTNTQAAGLYWKIDYNLGELTFVSELGVPTAVANLAAIVAGYTYTTNVYKFDTDLGALKVEEKWDDFLYRFGLRKNIIEYDRYHACNFSVMSGTVRTQAEQARSFVESWARKGTDLSMEGNLGQIKGVQQYASTAPGLAMGDQRVVIGERGITRYRMTKPWTMNPLENQKDSSGRFTGKKEAYGDQFIVLHTPTLLKGALTSMALYSSSTRVSR